MVDDYLSIVGSSNLDFRSFHFDFECNVLVVDGELGQTMAGRYRQYLNQARELDWPNWNHLPRWRR